MFVTQENELRFERRRSAHQSGHDRAFPPHAAMLAEAELRIIGGDQSLSARFEFALERFQRGGPERASMNTFCAGIGGEAEAVELADGFAGNQHRARIVNTK